MKNERLESALELCRRNDINSNRLKKYYQDGTIIFENNRESKKRQSKKNQDRVKMISRPKNLSNY